MNNSFIDPEKNKGFLFLKSIQEKDGQHGGPWGGEGGIVTVGNDGDFLDEGFEVSRFLCKFFNSIKVENKVLEVLEFGTNYGSFSWVLYESLGNGFRLKTCDIVRESGECVNSLNKIYDSNQVEFTHTNSTDLVRELIHQDYNPDVIYIDGSHTSAGFREDLESSVLLKSKYIIVDDYSQLEDVRNTLHKFLSERTDYKIFKYSNLNRTIGSQITLKRLEGEWKSAEMDRNYKET